MKRYWIPLVVITLFVYTGCGGGTSGTSSTGGETSIRVIAGSVVKANDSAAPGIRVALVGDSAEVTTDKTGSFELERETNTEIALTLTSEDRVIELKLPKIAPDTKVVTVDAKLNQDQTNASAQTIEGRVAVSNTCNQYTTIRGDSVSLTLPTGSVECSLEYQFLGEVFGLENSRLEVTKNNCQGTTFTTSGAQLDGSLASIFQVVRANKQRGICTATVRAIIPETRTNQRFTLKIQQRTSMGETPPESLNVSYEGQLSFDSGTTDSKSCGHFNASNTRLRFSVNESKVTANFLSEGIKLTGEVQGSGTTDEDRYGITQAISSTETVHVYPVATIGNPRAAFWLDYSQQSSEGTCRRTFVGVIPVKN